MTSVKQTVTLLHRALLLLLKDSLNFSNRLQVVGAVCITVDDDSSDLVIKFNDILQRDELNAPLNLAQHGTGGLQAAYGTAGGGAGAQNGQGAGNKLGMQHGGKRKAGKGQAQRINVGTVKRGSALANEALESEGEEVEAQGVQAEAGVSSQSEAASSVDDPSYIACAARSADSGSKKRKVSTSGAGARCSLGTTVPGNRGASASAKRKGGSNGSAADYKGTDGVVAGDELKAGANGRGAARQSGWAASSRKRSPCSCQVCGMVFCSRAVLERHALRHFGVRPYECSVCSERFYRKDQALTHVKKAHDGCTPAESYVAEKVGKTESRQLIEQLAHANANPGGATLGAPDDSMEPDADADAEDHKPDPPTLTGRMRTPVGVGGLPTFVSAMPPSGVNANVRFDGTSMMTDSDADDDDDDAGVAKNDDELDDDEEDADADNEQRNSPGIASGDPTNASGESLSWLIQQKRTRGELLYRGAGSRNDHRTLAVRDTLRKLANEDEDDEQRGRGGDDEQNEETDEDAAILRPDEEVLFGFGGAAMAMPGAIDNDDDDDGDAGASSAD